MHELLVPSIDRKGKPAALAERLDREGDERAAERIEDRDGLRAMIAFGELHGPGIP